MPLSPNTIAILFLSLLGAVACTSTGGGSGAGGMTDDDRDGPPRAEGAGAAGERTVLGDPGDGPVVEPARSSRETSAPAPPSPAVIYFAYDRSDVPGDYVDLVAEHARYILNAGALGVRVEGHADERGSREYNIGLGERRAQAVRQLLMLNGVPGARLATVSYGEERPVAFGHDEAAWARNRRVEIVYDRP